MSMEANKHSTQSTVHIKLHLPLLVAWLAVLLGVTFLLPDRVWNTLLIGLGGLFVVAYGWVHLLADGLQAHRSLRFGWIAVGDRLEEVFEIHNVSPVPALWVQVIDQSNVPGYRAAVVRSVGGKQVDRWRESAVCQQRGQFHLGPWLIRSSDPFGIFTVTRRYATSEEIIIHPPIHGQLPVRLPSGQSQGNKQVRQRHWQATINSATVRAYQPGDPQHWIHWRTSARKNDLFIRQFDLDVAGDIWLLLDLQAATQLGQGVHGTEEHTVLLAASLAARALRQNRSVGLAGYGQVPQVIAPAQGQGQQWKILRGLALLQADGTADLAVGLRDLKHIARRGTTAVIITPNATATWLPALLPLSQQGIQSHVILLDRASFGGDGNSQGVRDAIRRFGFGCDLVRRGEVGTPLETQARRGFWEFKVTGMGKAILVQQPDEYAAS